jgi:hypothetical protein
MPQGAASARLIAKGQLRSAKYHDDAVLNDNSRQITASARDLLPILSLLPEPQDPTGKAAMLCGNTFASMEQDPGMRHGRQRRSWHEPRS